MTQSKLLHTMFYIVLSPVKKQSYSQMWTAKVGLV